MEDKRFHLNWFIFFAAKRNIMSDTISVKRLNHDALDIESSTSDGYGELILTIVLGMCDHLKNSGCSNHIASHLLGELTPFLLSFCVFLFYFIENIL